MRYLTRSSGSTVAITEHQTIATLRALLGNPATLDKRWHETHAGHVTVFATGTAETVTIPQSDLDVAPDDPEAVARVAALLGHQ